jgi:transducin (beta)-like 1
LRAGSLHKVLTGHQGPVFSLKYSKNGAMLLTGSVDKSVIVWDTKTGTIKQHLKQHEGAVLDVAWRTNTSFATCSTDQSIHIYRLDKDTPMRRLTGHHGEVNCINWAPSGKLLASCSDDCTAKMWNLTSVRCWPLPLVPNKLAVRVRDSMACAVCRPGQIYFVGKGVYRGLAGTSGHSQ